MARPLSARATGALVRSSTVTSSPYATIRSPPAATSSRLSRPPVPRQFVSHPCVSLWLSMTNGRRHVEPRIARPAKLERRRPERSAWRKQETGGPPARSVPFGYATGSAGLFRLCTCEKKSANAVARCSGATPAYSNAYSLKSGRTGPREWPSPSSA